MFKNFSSRSDGEVRNWFPYDLKAEEIVVLPDINPGKAPLPTGCAIRTKQENWRKFAISDVGCGMILLKSTLERNQHFEKTWDALVPALQKNKGTLGDLGSGNHFLDAFICDEDSFLYFLIHTGSRDESSKVEALTQHPHEFDKVFEETVLWAEQNRLMIAKEVEKHFGKTEVVFHKNHNHSEITDNGVIIRKGAVKVEPGEITILPSHMTGEAVLVKAKEGVKENLCSLSHGTGRVMSRSEAKECSRDYDFNHMRKQIYIPACIDNSSLKTDAPYCYRSIDDVMALLNELAEEIKRFKPIAYIGHI